MKTLAYVYKWTQKSTNKWYVGSRTGKNSHPNDGYICSSRTVKPMILSNPSDWERTILCIGEPADMYQLEVNYLHALNAVKDPMSFNKHNGNGKCARAGLEGTFKGKTHSLESLAKIKMGIANMTEDAKMAHNKKLSDIAKARPRNKHSEETKAKIALGRAGKKHSEETRMKMSIAIRASKQKGVN